MDSAFSQFGVEIELMIVEPTTLDVRPVADQVLLDHNGLPDNAVRHGLITWSNELVLHVLEFKVSEPVLSLDGLDKVFHKSILEADGMLAKLPSGQAGLLGSSMHPWFDPANETRLWPHDDREIYDTFHRIFNCSGHGWSNLQSFHLNLPFGNDSEFRRLHSAIRLVLPLIPALAASSPFADGRATGHLDTRLATYRHNCDLVPSVTAGVIPDVYVSEEHYRAEVFTRIARDIAPLDPEEILEPLWVNARGAIARFDRGAIEIRVGDTQECPRRDMAILQWIVDLLQQLHREDFSSMLMQEEVTSEALRGILDNTIRVGKQAVVSDPAMLRAFGCHQTTSVADLIRSHLPRDATTSWLEDIVAILAQGNLSERLLRALPKQNPIRTSLRAPYQELRACLLRNEPYTPN